MKAIQLVKGWKDTIKSKLVTPIVDLEEQYRWPGARLQLGGGLLHDKPESQQHVAEKIERLLSYLSEESGYLTRLHGEEHQGYGRMNGNDYFFGLENWVPGDRGRDRSRIKVAGQAIGEISDRLLTMDRRERLPYLVGGLEDMPPLVETSIHSGPSNGSIYAIRKPKIWEELMILDTEFPIWHKATIDLYVELNDQSPIQPRSDGQMGSEWQIPEYALQSADAFFDYIGNVYRADHMLLVANIMDHAGYGTPYVGRDLKGKLIEFNREFNNMSG